MNQIDTKALVTAYKEIATSTIGHVLDQGYIPQVFPLRPEDKVVGIVRTVRIESINASGLRQVLMSCQPNEVLVIDARYDLQRACWGEQRRSRYTLWSGWRCGLRCYYRSAGFT